MGVFDHVLNTMIISRRQAAYSFLKKRECWWVVVGIDWLAIPLALFFNKYFKKITPNDISISSLLLFIVGLFVLYLDKNVIAASVLFYLSTVFDCVDGKLARLKPDGSKFGAVVDATVDAIIHSVGFVFIAFWLRDNLDANVSFFIVLAYSFYMLKLHIDDITNVLSKKRENKVAIELLAPESIWGKFTLKRGLVANPLNHLEMSFLVIPLISINLNNPDLFIMVAFSVFFGIRGIREMLRVVVTKRRKVVRSKDVL